MNENEIFYMLMNENTDKHILLNEIFAIRDNSNKINDNTICVNGYISLDAINDTIKKELEIENLKSEVYELNCRIKELLK